MSMLGPASGFLLAILGCGEGDAQCQQVAVAPATFQTEAACLAASEPVVAQHADADFPVVVAQCRRAGERSASLHSGQVRRPDADAGRPRLRTASASR
jgi:hypothetical protein